MSTSTSLYVGTDLTAEEVARASQYLAETAQALEDATAGLTDGQWCFKPARDRWSIAEILEHVVIVETLIQAKIAAMPDAPAPAADWEQREIDAAIPIRVANRDPRFSAPEIICPSGRLRGPELKRSFAVTRSRTMHLLSAPALRGHVIAHPISGSWDGYQWLLATAAHSARHTDQILELKADEGFPRQS